MKYFLVFLFFSLQLNAQTTCTLVNLGASYECLINPKGGFFKQNPIPPDPEPPEVAQAPTKIMLSDIDPNITENIQTIKSVVAIRDEYLGSDKLTE